MRRFFNTAGPCNGKYPSGRFVGAPPVGQRFGKIAFSNGSEEVSEPLNIGQPNVRGQLHEPWSYRKDRAG